MNANAQSSTEFLLITAAIAALSITVVAAYVHFVHVQKQIYSGMLAEHGYNITSVIQHAANTLTAYVIFPNLTTVNKTATGYLIVAGPGNITANVELPAVQGIAEYPNQISKQFNGFGVLSFAIMPLHSGDIALPLYFTLTSSNGSIKKNLTETFDAVGQSTIINRPSNNSTKYSQLSGQISSSLEEIGYYASQNGPAYAMTYWSHCTYHNWWTGGVEPENQQCGPNTWGFDTGDPNCNPFIWNGDDRYYCFARQQSSFSTGSIGQKPNYIYSITLYLTNATVSMYAKLNSSSSSGKVLGKNGDEYGTARVVDEYGQPAYPLPYSSYSIIYSDGTGKIINISSYSAYSTTWYDLVQQLNAYNNTGGGNLGYIESLISTLNNEQLELSHAAVIDNSGCSAGNLSSQYAIICNATSPLDFIINITLNPTIFQNVNQTIYMQGSEVRVR